MKIKKFKLNATSWKQNFSLFLHKILGKSSVVLIMNSPKILYVIRIISVNISRFVGK